MNIKQQALSLAISVTSLLYSNVFTTAVVANAPKPHTSIQIIAQQSTPSIEGIRHAQDTSKNNLSQFADDNKRGPSFIIDPSRYAPATHFIFLETKDDQLTPDYIGRVAKLVRAIASQPGFRASMTLADIDLKRMVVYYQFESEEQWKAAYGNANIAALAQSLQSDSMRFDDYAVNPREQGANGGTNGTPPPGYYAQFRMGDGIGINEAVVAKGRKQAELSALMRKAGTVANPNTSPGFKDFTFHEAIDGSRNMNILHWSNGRTMTVAALGTLIQNLINNGLTGSSDGWGPTGPGYIGVHLYNIVEIQNGKRFP
jgi:heme-degrading monooxygenase HmoA